jgi:hypothetical protein
MYQELFTNKKTVTVHQWELDLVSKWETEAIRDRIWLATGTGQPIPGCVSVEALRVELTRRGEPPIGYHEDIEDVSMDGIEIENSSPQKRRGGR